MARAPQTKNVPQSKSGKWLWLAAIVPVCVALGWWLLPQRHGLDEPEPEGTTPAAQKKIFARYAGSESCKDCHKAAYDLFKASHHELAEREFNAQDARYFNPAQAVKHGSQASEVRADGSRYQLVTSAADGKKTTYPLERVLGVDPLIQFLVPAPGGRLQMTELAADPRKGDWFDIFGEEDRRRGEWGHWTGRGMNWNSMCAVCHNTRVFKNYDEGSDSYSTAMAMQGVGCEGCHGPMGQHVEWAKEHPGTKQKDPTLNRLDRDQMLATCGPCHSRRAELTGDFRPGQKFSDHFSLTIPDHTDTYYPDGQIRDEDYEYASFLSSRMYVSGVRCVDCHDPHSAKIRMKGNDLCLRCHAPPVAPAPKIDPLAHGHHKLGEPGSLCVDCHMPQTTYMQRHARRDHGMIIPDPLLTKKYNIPNACERCHKDKGTDWNLEAVEKWYGPKMDRVTRTRAIAVAEGRALQAGSRDKLLEVLKEEKVALWRAVEIGLLRDWSSQPEVQKAILGQVGDASPIVRAMVARALDVSRVQTDGDVAKALSDLSQDPVRNVRVEAAWALHASIDTNGVAGKDLLAFLRQNIDQPAGVLQLGTFYFDRGENDKALPYFKRAVSWDTNSAPLRHALAVSLSAAGRTEEAVNEMKAACVLAPNEAEYQFNLGLALSEAGNRLPEAAGALEAAVKINPQFAAAWYNLGLARAGLNELEPALQALTRAETLDPSSPRYPYARATVLARLRRFEEAREAAVRILELEPSSPDAISLLQSLGPGGR